MSSIFLQTQHAMGIEGVSILIVSIAMLVFIFSYGVNRITLLRIKKNKKRSQDLSLIMQHTLKMSRNYVLKLSVLEQWGYNLQGNFLPDEGMSYQESLGYIHTDDRQKYTIFLNELIHGNKTAECTIRWDSSLGRHEQLWCHLHMVAIVEVTLPNQPFGTNIYCAISDHTDLIEEEQQEIEMSNRYRKIFEQSIAGLAFYDKNGYLLEANRKIREILKFQSEKDPYYYNNGIFDLPTFRELIHNHTVEDLFFCTKSVILERGVNCYTEIRVHPILDDHKELVYITLSLRDLTPERQLNLQQKENEKRIRQQNSEIQQYESELQYLMEQCNMRFWRSSYDKNEVIFYKGLSKPESVWRLDTFYENLINPTELVKQKFIHPRKYFTEAKTYLCHSQSLFHEHKDNQWNSIDTVPYYDDNGYILGCYGIIRNVTDLIEKQERLKEETEQANQSGQKKSAFMANMTHEIRTPLNAIVGFSDVLPMMSTPEEKSEIIRVIMNNCDMLLRLVNDILAVSALDSGGIKILPEKVDFAKDFNDSAISLAQRVQTSGVEFQTDSPYQSFVTIIDSGRIQQVITNFVTNAIKYTQQGHIKIGYRREERHGTNGLFVYCEDTGAGIPKESQKKVFDRFVKLNDYIQGTGLGLSICKAIADSCHGEIGVYSEGEGKGSLFWIWIPCEEIKDES